jgi:single-strand DNA-binding protein
LNKVILMGRLTKDVEIRQTPNNLSVARFTIAVNRRFVKDDGQQADFINCIAWRKTGEFIARYFQKGSMIAVVGSIQTRSWDGNDGKKQYATEVIVNEAYFTGSKSENSTGSNTDLSDSGLDDLNSQYGEDFATIGDEEDLPF